MKKNLITVLLAVSLSAMALTACGQKAEEPAVEAEAVVEEEAAVEEEATTEEAGVMEDNGTATEEAEELTATGVISDIKDFGFTLTTEDGKAYMITFDAENGTVLEGFDTVKDGDKVVVTYFGELSETDNLATPVKVELAK